MTKHKTAKTHPANKMSNALTAIKISHVYHMGNAFGKILENDFKPNSTPTSVYRKCNREININNESIGFYPDF